METDNVGGDRELKRVTSFPYIVKSENKEGDFKRTKFPTIDDKSLFMGQTCM